MNDKMRLQQFGEGAGFRVDTEMSTQFTQVQDYATKIEEVFDPLIGCIINANLIRQLFQVRRLVRMHLAAQFIEK